MPVPRDTPFLLSIRPPLPPGPHHLAAALPLACAPQYPLSPPPPSADFRFWLDESLWSRGREAVQLIEAVLIEAGGSRTGGPPRGRGSRYNGGGGERGGTHVKNGTTKQGGTGRGGQPGDGGAFAHGGGEGGEGREGGLMCNVIPFCPPKCP